MDGKKIMGLVFFFIVVSAVAFFGSFPTDDANTLWYESLSKPSWNPPKWLFAPVWSILYFMIALAGWLYFIADYSFSRKTTLFYYFIQLALNAIWPYVFFTMKSPGLGLINLFFMAFFIGMTILEGRKVSQVASFLLIPYLIWTIYALSINAGTYYLN